MQQARQEVAALLGCAPEEIVFTSGATEANNTVLKGVAAHHGRGQIITAATEHPAVLAPCRYLQSQGFGLTILPVDGAGRVDPDEVRRALTPDTILISVMHANNETGALQPLREIGALAREAGVAFHTDAAQSVGKIPVDVDELQVDFLTVAGHKFYAPKGVGALYVRGGAALTPLLHGASQEGGRRAGTENVPYMVALGAACRLARERLPGAAAHLQGLRDRLHELLKAGVPGLILNGPEVGAPPQHPERLLPGDCPGATSWRACRSWPPPWVRPATPARRPSPRCWRPWACPWRVARGAVRFSVGCPTTRAEVDQAAALLLEQAASAPGEVR